MKKHLLLAISCFLPVMVFAQPYAYTIRKVAVPIVVDGDLNEWKQVTPASPFVIHDTGGKTLHPASAFLLWDEEYLYIAFQVSDEDLCGVYEKHDDPIFLSDDLVEVFFDFDGDSVDYVELGVSVMNTGYDYIIHCNESAYCGGAWSNDRDYTIPGMFSAVQRRGTVNRYKDRDEGYSVEIRIPFSGLAKGRGTGFSKPVAGTVWKGNLFRIDYDTNVQDGRAREYQSFSPHSGFGFHRPQDFASFIFSGETVSGVTSPVEEKPKE